jgi:hypothetical protein
VIHSHLMAQNESFKDTSADAGTTVAKGDFIDVFEDCVLFDSLLNEQSL